jgi:shikimate kinase
MSYPSRIFLIGFMGAGKSAVGAGLAKELGYAWCDVDREVLNSTGSSSISQLFDNMGEDRFRRLEAEILHGCQDAQSLVVSTGGGLVTNRYAQECFNTIRTRDLVVYIEVSFETALQRVGNQSDRPLLRDREAARKLYDSRIQVYEDFKGVKINSEGRTLEQLVAELSEYVKSS